MKFNDCFIFFIREGKFVINENKKNSLGIDNKMLMIDRGTK